MDIIDNIICRTCTPLRARIHKCGILLDTVAGDRQLAREALVELNRLEQSPSLRGLYAVWQIVIGLEGWVHHQMRVQEITGEKKSSKFL